MLIKRYYILLLVLVVTANVTSYSQYNYIFEHLSTKDGLSHNNVSGMMKDKQGFMWFATWDGLNRYDGSDFKVYKQKESFTNAASNRFARLKEDANGNIWVATNDSKAYRFNTATESFESIPFFNADSVRVRVSNIMAFDNGEVWLLSQDAGLCIVKTDVTTNAIHLTFLNKENILPGNAILFAEKDGEGNTWISTNNGMVVLLNDGSDRVVKLFPLKTTRLLSQYRYSCFVEGDENFILGTESGELVFINKTDLAGEVRTLKGGAKITGLCLQKGGAVYAGTFGNGVVEFDIWKDTITYHYNEAVIQKVLKMYLDTKGMLWIESTEAGISSVHVRTRVFRHYQQALDVNPDIRSTAQCGLMEGEHYLWLTLKGGGFGYYNYQTGDLEYFFNKPESAERKLSNFVNCFYKDPSGVLWMSTYFKGIEKVSLIQKQFQLIQPAPQSKYSIANEVRALMYDTKGYLWVATKNKEVFILDEKYEIKKKISFLNNQSIGRVYALYEDSKGTIYLGSKGEGLFVLKRQGDLRFSSTHYTHQDTNAFSISNNNIYDFQEDKNGDIWIGTYGGGINRFDGTRFYNVQNKHINAPEEIGRKVRCVNSDDNGNLWVATTDGLLFMGGDKSDSVYTFYAYTPENGKLRGLYGSDVFWVFSDNNQQVWVSSLGGGFSKLNDYPEGPDSPLEFTSLRKSDGLPSDMVFSIINDEQDNLWMATEDGIVFYNTKTHLIKEFGQYAGIENAFFSEGALAKDTDGNIVIGAKNGFYQFNPSKFNNEQQTVNLLFTDFKIFGESVVPGTDRVISRSVTFADKVLLKHNQNAFSISWAGLDYGLQNRLQFQYKLIGYDDVWHLAKDENEASYIKIPPGKYVFQLQFLNPELQNVNEPIQLSIRVKPPFWLSIGAYIFYFLAIVVLAEVLRRTAITIIRLRNKVVVEKELSELKLSFFTNISHELRTPLTLILGPVREIKAAEKLTDKGKGHVSLIEDNTKRLLNLVNQLLDFRKIQHKKMPLKITRVNIAELANDVAHHFMGQAQEKRIRFTVSTFKENIFVHVDIEKIRTVLFNLLSNAFKFIPENGIVEVLVNQLPEEESILIEVRDNGKGISAEEEANLFTPFMSQGNSTTNYLKGTGIGLALSKELVNLHQGTLTYQQQASGGAVFKVLLPFNSLADTYTDAGEGGSEVLNEASENVAENELMQVEHTGKPCVLIVEDNTDLRHFLQLQLSDDYQLLQAKDGVEALNCAVNKQPDLILSDIMMPNMDGIELLDKIKQTSDTSHIPVVLLTAKTSVESKVEGLRYGADAYLTKPFERDQLKAQLDNILQRRKFLRDYYARDSASVTLNNDVNVTDKDKSFLLNVQDLIERNLSNPNFKMETLYADIGMGRSKFSNKLKGLTGVSPVEFVRAFRLNKAHALLKTGQHNVTEVAYIAGFTDPAYFSKSYKERFGVNPSEELKKQSF